VSCVRARGWLEAHDIPFAVRDLFKQPLGEAEIRDLAERVGGVRNLFSWRSPSVKKLNVDPQTATDDELVALMQREPRLIRRPLVDVAGNLIVGATPKTLEAGLSPQ
jgi:regulatory protein spx